MTDLTLVRPAPRPRSEPFAVLTAAAGALVGARAALVRLPTPGCSTVSRSG